MLEFLRNQQNLKNRNQIDFYELGIGERLSLTAHRNLKIIFFEKHTNTTMIVFILLEKVAIMCLYICVELNCI